MTMRSRTTRSRAIVSSFIARCNLIAVGETLHEVRPLGLRTRRHLWLAGSDAVLLDGRADRPRRPAAAHPSGILLRLHRHRARVAGGVLGHCDRSRTFSLA